MIKRRILQRFCISTGEVGVSHHKSAAAAQHSFVLDFRASAAYVSLSARKMSIMVENAPFLRLFRGVCADARRKNIDIHAGVYRCGADTGQKKISSGGKKGRSRGSCGEKSKKNCPAAVSGGCFSGGGGGHETPYFTGLL